MVSVVAALQAITVACRATRSIQPSGLDDDDDVVTMAKHDTSPVTVGDYASQALALDVLHRHFPDDEYIAEEDGAGSGGANDDYDDEDNTITGGGGRGGKRRVWCLDPIDGTKGFLRGRVTGGHTSIDYDELLGDCNDIDGPTHRDNMSWRRLRVTPNDGSYMSVSSAKFCLGVERSFSDPDGTVLKLAREIHGHDDALITDLDGNVDIVNSMRMDGQGKYGLLARGDAQFFVRLPKRGYVDWVWDVAPGYLVLTEAGGCVTDVDGRPIDLSGIGHRDGLDDREDREEGRRAKLPDHVRGIVGSCGGVFHRALLDAMLKMYLPLKTSRKGTANPQIKTSSTSVCPFSL
ncbi:hypothetical protein ACHAXA_011418 [Cyclostephanos tholiformis]|uniref:Uncharacterized protein n=1 Tax=Cyclostephanos tholiformis TaxID=382380 RepID=A0ABD3RV44_9STRA